MDRPVRDIIDRLLNEIPNDVLNRLTDPLETASDELLALLSDQDLEELKWAHSRDIAAARPLDDAYYRALLNQRRLKHCRAGASHENASRYAQTELHLAISAMVKQSEGLAKNRFQPGSDGALNPMVILALRELIDEGWQQKNFILLCRKNMSAPEEIPPTGRKIYWDEDEKNDEVMVKPKRLTPDNQGDIWPDPYMTEEGYAWIYQEVLKRAKNGDESNKSDNHRSIGAVPKPQNVDAAGISCRPEKPAPSPLECPSGISEAAWNRYQQAQSVQGFPDKRGAISTAVRRISGKRNGPEFASIRRDLHRVLKAVRDRK